MAIRLRTVNCPIREHTPNGRIRVALCAAETDSKDGDLYLDDGDHYALAAKFARDWHGQTVDWTYQDHDEAADTQKLRDAKEELDKWLAEQQENG